eukprot:gnl/Trimastix_PCT/4098.p1 GENE.gnl/Trimastix_PCT/4098~~gnl/Trimastix_PCT/4098.p1  ORF type:complete len:244 (+),score=50.54 gnl/Trimastix_PCT/4098:73-732(+)
MADRLKNQIITKQICYGNVGVILGKHQGEFTHRWSLFVRSPTQEDMSKYLSKVIFELHPTFADHMREFTEPPYEVVELGWGEFDLQIHLHFKNEYERPVTFNHRLKLFPPQGVEESPKRPIISETCEELIFVNPRQPFADLLCGDTSAPPARDYTFQSKFPPHNDQEEYTNLVNSIHYVDSETERIIKMIEEQRGSIDELRREIANLEEEKKKRRRKGP